MNFTSDCRLESGASARVKPFGVEIRNVKCARCGTFGHQSGDRECPLKDSITPSEEARQRRDDPLTAIMNAVSNEVFFFLCIFLIIVLLGGMRLNEVFCISI